MVDPFAAEAETLRPDPAALAAFWGRFALDGATYEVRCPNTRRGPLHWYGTAAGYFTDRAAFVQHVARITGADAPGAYITLNPAQAELRGRANNRLLPRMKATTPDAQITARRRLLFDFDPVRAADIPATEAELAAALQVRDACEAFLADLGWPPPLYRLMTGNGGGLVYAVELPNDEAATALVRACLAGAADAFDTDAVTVDQTVSNAARITRVPGTVNAKGDSVPELGRIWRRVTAEYPPDAGVVPREQLEALAALAPAQTPDGPTFTWEPAGGRHWQVADKLTAAGVGFETRARLWGTVYRLDRCLTSDQHADGAAIFERSDGRLGYRCHHNSCADRHWTDVRTALGLHSEPFTVGGSASMPPPNSGAADSGARTSPIPWPVAPADVAYYGLAGEIVRMIAPHSEADPVALLAQLLAGVGNLIGRMPYFRAEADRHYPNLFTVLVGSTAKGRKGSSWGQVSRVLHDVDEAWATRCVLSGLSSGEGLIWAVRDPITKREAVQDSGPLVRTYQEIEVDPGVTDKRLLALEAEYASVLRVVSREGNTLSAIIREAWDTGNLRTLTKNSPAKATGAHISLIGHITRDELRAVLDSTEAANGFANRHLWLCVRRSKCLPRGGNLQDAALAPLVDRLRAAVTFARTAGEIAPSENAWAVWEAVYPELSEGRPGLLGAVVSRAEAQTMRLAMQYALLDCSRTIEPVHLRAALAFWEYAEASARYIFGDALGDPLADELLAALRGHPEGLSRTEIRDLFSRHKRAGAIDAALARLADLGLAECTQENTGGRPAQRWCATRTGATKAT